MRERERERLHCLCPRCWASNRRPVMSLLSFGNLVNKLNKLNKLHSKPQRSLARKNSPESQENLVSLFRCAKLCFPFSLYPNYRALKQLSKKLAQNADTNNNNVRMLCLLYLCTFFPGFGQNKKRSTWLLKFNIFQPVIYPSLTLKTFIKSRF